MILLRVDGEPRPEPRPRGTRTGDGRVRMYVPKSAHAWKHQIRAAYVEAYPASVIPAPPPAAFVVSMSFAMPRPKGHYRTGRHSGRLKSSQIDVRPTGKPDVDNLVKAVLDAFGAFDGGCPLVWCDDAQVVELGNTAKRYAAEGEAPGVAIAIWRV